MILHDVKRIAVILRYFSKIGTFGANYVTIEVRSHCLRQKCSPQNVVFGSIWFMLIFSQVT